MRKDGEHACKGSANMHAGGREHARGGLTPTQHLTHTTHIHTRTHRYTHMHTRTHTHITAADSSIGSNKRKRHHMHPHQSTTPPPFPNIHPSHQHLPTRIPPHQPRPIQSTNHSPARLLVPSLGPHTTHANPTPPSTRTTQTLTPPRGRVGVC